MRKMSIKTNFDIRYLKKWRRASYGESGVAMQIKVGIFLTESPYQRDAR